PREGGHRLHECTERPVRDAFGQLILEVEVLRRLGGSRALRSRFANGSRLLLSGAGHLVGSSASRVG
ncbi:MAG: hypothetical protein ACRDS0_42085, partial [Pseudonocardiaceae bacterium]